MPSILVPVTRWPRWVENFERSHGPTDYAVVDGALNGTGEDGSTVVARLPFATAYDGPAEPVALVDALVVPDAWGVLLVRKGGFAVALVRDGGVVASKVGQRHVQGRTKAGGQSQQRFARRRDNQARQAYEAAGDHAARVLDGLRGMVVTGGDRPAVDEVLEDVRLRDLVVCPPWLAVPDPRRAVLDQAIADAQALQVEVVNA